jgi:hypothetical protein
MLQISKAAFVVLITCLMLNLPVTAQIKTNYHFGFIGTIGDTSAKLSEPLIIQYSQCFEITNGLSRFTPAKSGVFAISCVEVPAKVDLLVHVYPNPVVNQLTIRSLTNYPEKGLVKYTVVLTDFTGRHIREIKTDIASINKGFAIGVNDLPQGFFIVTLYADKEIIQSFKVFKAA